MAQTDATAFLPLDVELRISPNQVVSDLGEETVVFNLDSSCYYSLNPVAASIWALLQEPRSVSGLLEHLMREYDVEMEQCQADLDELLRELLLKGMIQIVAKRPG